MLDVYLSSDGLAFGELYTDDGISLHTISHAEFLYVTFNATMVSKIMCHSACFVLLRNFSTISCHFP